MEDSMAPQTFLYGCTLEAGKDVTFNPEDEFEHQLDLRMVCVDQTTKDEINTVEVEGQDAEGQKVKAVLASLKPSTLPSVCLGGFSITPPAVFRLKAGSGPVHISGQCLVMMESELSSDEEFDEEEEEEEEEVEDVKASKKRPAASPALKSKKKMKMEIDEDDDEDDEDDTMEDESPVKAKPKGTPAKAKAQNGQSPKPKPANKEKPGKGKGEKSPKTSPSTPRTPLTVPEVKAKITEAIKKGVSLPKIQVKFQNFVRNSYKVEDTKVLADLWQWKKTLETK